MIGRYAYVLEYVGSKEETVGIRVGAEARSTSPAATAAVAKLVERLRAGRETAEPVKASGAAPGRTGRVCVPLRQLSSA